MRVATVVFWTAVIAVGVIYIMALRSQYLDNLAGDKHCKGLYGPHYELATTRNGDIKTCVDLDTKEIMPYERK